MQLIKVKEN